MCSGGPIVRVTGPSDRSSAFPVKPFQCFKPLHPRGGRSADRAQRVLRPPLLLWASVNEISCFLCFLPDGVNPSHFHPRRPETQSCETERAEAFGVGIRLMS